MQKPSVKNFILEDAIAQREVLMLGKTKDDIFHVDVSWPLKPYVAFCICIANNDSQYTGNWYLFYYLFFLLLGWLNELKLTDGMIEMPVIPIWSSSL